MDMAGCGTGQGHGQPVPPAQNNEFPPWGAQPPTSAQYPASQHINNPSGYSYGGAPNAVLCQTSDGVTGFMIWHGDPNAFPAVAQIQYGNGPVYPAACPSQSTDWGSMLPPTPESALISTQGFVPRHDPSLPVAQYQPKPGARDGIPPVPLWDEPRVMPMQSAGEIDLLNFGQWQGQAVPAPVPVPVPGLGITAVEIRERRMIEPRPVVESTMHTMDLLTQPMTSHEPSYIHSGKGQKRNIWEGSIEEISIDDEVGSPDIFDEIFKDQSKSPNITENDGGSSTSGSKEATTSLEPSPLILSSSIASPVRRRKNVAKPSTPVKRFLATSITVQSRKKRPATDGAVRFPTPSYVPGAVRLPVVSETITDLEDYAAGLVVELPQGLTMPEGYTEEVVDYSSFFSVSPKWEAEMDSVFDFDGASLSWKNDPFWDNEDSTRTREHGCSRHPMMVFKGTKKAPFDLDAWVDDELEMSLWSV